MRTITAQDCQLVSGSGKDSALIQDVMLDAFQQHTPEHLEELMSVWPTMIVAYLEINVYENGHFTDYYYPLLAEMV